MKKFKHVVIFGSDGFGAYLLESLLKQKNKGNAFLLQEEKNKLKNFSFLLENGAYSLTHRSVFPIMSCVNWTSILFGLQPNLHGYTEWNSDYPELETIFAYKKPESLFSLFKKQIPREQTQLFFRWPQIGRILNLKNIDHAYNLLNFGDEKKWGKTTVSHFIEEDNNFVINEKIVEKAIVCLKKNKPSLSFIYVNEPDTTGHEIGHQTREIYQASKWIDKWLGLLLETIKTDKLLKEETLLVFVADHGGQGKGDDCHGNFNNLEINIPLIFFTFAKKKNFQKGKLIEKTLQSDIAPTIAWILGLKIPHYWNGKIIKSPFVKKEKLDLYRQKLIVKEEKQIIIYEKRLSLFLTKANKVWLWKTIGLENSILRAKKYAQVNNIKKIKIKYKDDTEETIIVS